MRNNSLNGMKITLADDPDTDYLIAEIWHDTHHIADVFRHGANSKYHLVVYPNIDGGSWKLELDETIENLQRARNQFMG